MQNRQDFIDQHWQEAVKIDEAMRRAAAIYVKGFLGEKAALTMLLDREDWMKYDMPAKYLMFLAYRYSLEAIGARNLKLRPMVEALVAEVILQASLGDMPGEGPIRDELLTPTQQELEDLPSQSRDRMQFGVEMVRAYFQSRNAMPEKYDDVLKSQRMMLFWAASQFRKQLFRRVWPATGEIESRDIEAKQMLASLEKSVKKLGIRFVPAMDTSGWLVEHSKAQ